MSFNMQIIAGHVGTDPEVRYTPSGTAVASFTVATNKKWTDKNTGQKQEKVTWHKVTCFNKLGEFAGEYVKKGSLVLITGETDHQKYQDKKTGEDKYSTTINVRELQLLGGRQQAQSQGRPQPAAGQRQPELAAAGGVDDSGDIPF